MPVLSVLSPSDEKQLPRIDMTSTFNAWRFIGTTPRYRVAFALFIAMLFSSMRIGAAEVPTVPEHPTTQFRLASDNWPNIYVYDDTCQVYLIRKGNSAILFNLGDGSVLDHLEEIGVSKIE